MLNIETYQKGVIPTCPGQEQNGIDIYYNKCCTPTIIIDSDASVINKDSEFYDLAEAMQEIYPKGRKAGTTYQWRGAKAEIAKKLKTLVAKYKVNLNKEDVLQATRRYVNSFNGNYTKMRLLKYFILKNTLDAEGNAVFNSELLSLLENEEVEENDDWTTELV